MIASSPHHLLYTITSIFALTHLANTTPLLPTNPENLHITNNSFQPLNTSLSPIPFPLPTVPLPHYFPVPGTPVSLTLGFGWRRHSLPPMDLCSLIVVAAHQISQSIAEAEQQDPGEEHLYPIQANGRQKYEFEFGDGISIWVQNIGRRRYFTWEVLGDVVEGLRLFLVEGGRSRQCWFNFWDGPGLRPKGSGFVGWSGGGGVMGEE